VGNDKCEGVRSDPDGIARAFFAVVYSISLIILSHLKVPAGTPKVIVHDIWNRLVSSHVV